MLGANLSEGTQHAGVFTKGMTLEEYMAQINFESGQGEEESWQ
jgi:hypothetical protein